jgi:dihydroxyacetone kinase-like protein
MDAINAADLIRLFDSWKVLFAEKRDELIALDGKVGDSDLGITMSKGFAAAADAVQAEGEAAGVAKLLRTAGAAMARAAPSTMGTLTATGFIRAGKMLEGSPALGTRELAVFWAAFRDGVAERGKAKLGDKTLLDVLHPIALVMESQAADDVPLPRALAAAAACATGALEATKSMKAQHGKAAAFQDKTIGLQDAGATVGMLIAIRLSDFASAEP